MVLEARRRKGLSVTDVERATKIRARFIEAIESDRYDSLPSESYAKGFLKNYSEFLGLNSTVVLAFFRRQTREAPRSTLLPKGVTEPLNRSFFQLTPGKFLAMLLAGMFFLLLGYFVFQYRALNAPPVLTVDSPAENYTATERRIDVLGETDSDATVTINGVSTLVRSDGKFFDQVTLEPGVNHVVIVATSRYGKSASITRDVSFGP